MLSESEIEAIAERVLSRMEGRQDLFDRNLRGLGLIDVDELYENGVRVASSSRFPVVTADIADLAVTLAKLAANSVDGSKIIDGSIALADLASDSVDGSKIVDGAVDLDSKITEGTFRVVSHMAGFFIRGTYVPDQLNGGANVGEIDFDPPLAGAKYEIFHPDGSIITVTNANRSNMSQQAQESYTGKVYVVFSKQLCNSVRGLAAGQDSHILVIRFNSGTYQYDNNGSWISFTPDATDICVFEVDRSGSGWTGKPTRYVGMELLSYMETREKVKAALDDFGLLLADRVNTAAIINDAVSTLKIANDAITEAKVATDAITAGKIATDAVTTTKIQNDAITTPKLLASAVTTAKLAALAVTADKIAANAVVADKIAANAIVTGKIAALAVTADKIAADAVIADKIAAGAVLAEKLLVANFFNLLADGSFENTDDFNNNWSGSGGGGVWSRVASDGSANPFHGNWMLRYDTTGQSGLAIFGGPLPDLSQGVLRPGVVEANEGDVFALRARHRMAPGGGAASGAYARLEMVSVDEDGNGVADTLGPLFQPSTSAWATAEWIAPACPAGTAYVYVRIRISNSADNGPRYLFDGYELNRSVETVFIQDGAITADKLVAGSVITSKLAANAVTANEIAANAVTTSKIAASAVTADEIAANAIIASKIIADAIETSKINGLAVTTAKIADNATTIPSAAYTAGSVTISQNATTTVQSITYTSTGASVTVLACFEWEYAVFLGQLKIRLIRDSTTLVELLVYSYAASARHLFNFQIKDTPASGSRTYKIDVEEFNNVTTGTAYKRSISVLEVKK